MTTATLSTVPTKNDAILKHDDARTIARFFQALADPTRVRMLKAEDRDRIMRTNARDVLRLSR